ncbi:MAG: hypothetical protein JWN44_3572 [Myxococcales bacterium]|nr:hypothetical protein [Myxococcales bacterium]
MPNQQRHRGAHPEDLRLFDRSQLKRMRPAAEEIVWLLGRGYPLATAVELVGNHHQLEARQRTALQRSLCSPDQRRGRESRAVERTAARGRTLLVDGFNLIITVEVALSGGLILDCYDGTVRDLAGVRGSYHAVDETDAALDLIGKELGALAPAHVRFFLDAPVSNSGRLRARIEDWAHRWPFSLEASVVPNPDAILARADNAVTSDSAVLDRCGSWLNLGRFIVDRHVPSAWRSGMFTLPSRVGT